MQFLQAQTPKCNFGLLVSKFLFKDLVPYWGRCLASFHEIKGRIQYKHKLSRAGKLRNICCLWVTGSFVHPPP